MRNVIECANLQPCHTIWNRDQRDVKYNPRSMLYKMVYEHRIFFSILAVLPSLSPIPTVLVQQKVQHSSETKY